MTLASLLALVREDPVGAALDLGSLALAVLLPIATFALLLVVDPVSNPRPWVALVAVGVVFASLWTLWYPLYEVVARRA